MATNPNKLSQFWQELKRRNVVRVVTVYAGAAFVILELVDIIAEPLKLPSWLVPVVIVLLSIGFIIAVIMSWIYDVHPEGGMVKTEPVDKDNVEETPKSSNSWRVASYISFVVIAGLIILNVIPRSKRLKESEILEKSIAVLPFINDSPDDENTYFINGLMEEILLNLQAIKDFQIPGRTSVEPYRNQSKSIPEIADDLNVNYIIEGSGQKYGNTIRLRIQLLEGAKGMHIWGESFEKEIENPEDLFNIQSEIAQSIAAELQALITPQEKQLIEKLPTTSLTAYDYYHMGIEEENRRNLDRAEELFRKALAYDPKYANAFVGLARVYWSKHYWETIFEEDFLDSIRILVEKALSIDTNLSDAYTIRGRYYNQIGDLSSAIRDFDRALELNPNNGLAYLYGGSLYRQNDLVRSIQYSHKALALNRGDQLPSMLNNLGWAYLFTGFLNKSKYYYSESYKLTNDTLSYYNGLRLCEFVSENFSGSIEYSEKILALDSSNFNLHSWLGESYMMKGDYVQSLKHFTRWLEKNQLKDQNTVYGNHRVGWAYWMNGLKEEAEEFFLKQINYCSRILETGRVIGSTYRNYYDLAATYAFIGEKDKAYDNLRIYTQYPMIDRWAVNYISNDPLFDSLRDEPEFQQIVREVEAKYQAEHERVRQWLEENDML